MSGKICVSVKVGGRVQGVFFRDSTQQQAQKLGITGWIRNTPNGEVEAVFCGKEESVNTLVAWCHQGPPAAKVSSVLREDIPYEKHEQFTIRFDV